MSNEATSLATREMPILSCNYEIVHTIQNVASAIGENIHSCFKQQCGLVIISLQFKQGNERAAERKIRQSTQYYLNEMRKLVRRTDHVFMLDSTLFFMLLGANDEGARIVESRLWDALLWSVHNATEENTLTPCCMTIGHAAYRVGDGTALKCIMTASNPCYSFDIQSTPVKAPSQLCQPETYAASTEDETDTGDHELTSLARRLGVPYLSLLPRKRPEQVRRFVPLELVHELQCYPIGRERGTLTVALVNPQDSATLERLRAETGLRIFPVLTHPKEMQTALSFLV